MRGGMLVVTKRRLLGLREEIIRIAVKHHSPDDLHREQFFRDDEDIERHLGSRALAKHTDVLLVLSCM